jgi:hypothetical protein
LVLYLASQLAEQHSKALVVMAVQRFLDALPMVIEVGNLVLTVLNADALGHLRPRLNDSSNLVQDR